MFVYSLYTNLNHVVQRFLIAQAETFPDVQHVNLTARHHNANQGVISRAQTLQRDVRIKKQTFQQCTFTPLGFIAGNVIVASTFIDL